MEAYGKRARDQAVSECKWGEARTRIVDAHVSRLANRHQRRLMGKELSSRAMIIEASYLPHSLFLSLFFSVVPRLETNTLFTSPYEPSPRAPSTKHCSFSFLSITKLPSLVRKLVNFRLDSGFSRLLECNIARNIEKYTKCTIRWNNIAFRFDSHYILRIFNHGTTLCRMKKRGSSSSKKYSSKLSIFNHWRLYLLDFDWFTRDSQVQDGTKWR